MTTITTRQLAAIVGPEASRRLGELYSARAALATLDRSLRDALLVIHSSTDGWPTRNGEGGSSTGIGDPVASMVAARADVLELEAQWRMLWATVMAGVPTLANMTATIATRGAQLRQDATKPATCSADANHEGFAEWGRLGPNGLAVKCTDIVHAGGLCASCWAAQYRWKRARRDGRPYSRRGTIVKTK